MLSILKTLKLRVWDRNEVSYPKMLIIQYFDVTTSYLLKMIMRIAISFIFNIVLLK